MSLSNTDVLLSAISVKKMYSFKWEIPNFRRNVLAVGKFLRSSNFSLCDESSKTEWKLHLYPQGKSEEEKEYVSIILCLLSPVTVTIQFSLSILDDNNEKVHEFYSAKSTTFSKETYYAAGPLKFIRRSELLDIKKGLLNNGILTIICDIEISSEKNVQSKTDGRIDLTNKFKTLVDDPKYSDVKFVILKENKIIHAHKCILANQNAVFASIFERKIKENQEMIIDIEDIEYEVFKEILLFLYTGKVNEIEKHSKKLLLAADKYAIDDLKSMCEIILCDSLSVDNVTELIHLADTCSAKKLQEEAIKYMVSHIDHKDSRK